MNLGKVLVVVAQPGRIRAARQGPRIVMASVFLCRTDAMPKTDDVSLKPIAIVFGAEKVIET